MIILTIYVYAVVFEEKPHQNGGDGDATLLNSEVATPSSISSPTEPTKSTNLEETGSSNQTQDSLETTNRSKNMELEDTRQAPLALQEPDVEIKLSSGMTENHNRNV